MMGLYDLSQVGSRIEFSCPEGLSVIGARTVTCLHSGSWDSPAPACQHLKCPDILKIVQVRPLLAYRGLMNTFQDKKVKVTPVSDNSGGKVLFSCPRGFSLEGDKEATCQASNQWSIKVRVTRIILKQ